MLSIYAIKPKFQALLRPLVGWLFGMGVTPNAVTIAALLLSTAMSAAILVSAEPWLLPLVPLVLFVRMALNAVDGMLAREFDRQSRLGEILNEVCDFLSDMFIYGSLFVYAPESLLALSCFLLLTAFNEFTGVLAKSVIGIRHYHGPMGKSDRAFVLGSFCLVAFFMPSVWSVFDAFLSVLCVLLCVSSYHRIRAIIEV